MKSPQLFLISFLVLGFALSAASCRSVGLTQSGFLSDYSQLKVDPSERARTSFVSPALQGKVVASQKVYVEPLQFKLQDTSLDDLTPQQKQWLGAHYQQHLKAELRGRVEVLPEPEGATWVVRSALTEVDICNLWVNWFTAIVVIWPLDVGGATLEVEMIERATGEQWVAMVNADKATLWNGIQAMTRIGHACQAVEETASWLGARLDLTGF